MQDARRWWFVGSNQQGQGTCGLACLLGGAHEKWRYSQDFAWEELSPLYEHFTIALEFVSAKELTMEFVMTHWY